MVFKEGTAFGVLFVICLLLPIACGESDHRDEDSDTGGRATEGGNSGAGGNGEAGAAEPGTGGTSPPRPGDVGVGGGNTQPVPGQLPGAAGAMPAPTATMMTPPSPPPSSTLPTDEPLNGCATANQTADDNGCEMLLVCDEGVSAESSCQLSHDDEWSCLCTRGSEKISIGLVHTGAAAGACEVIAAGCTTGELSLGELSCSRELESRGIRSCHLQDRCEQVVSDGAWSGSALITLRYARCTKSADGPLECWCQDGESYDVDDTDPNTACDALMDVCATKPYTA